MDWSTIDGATIAIVAATFLGPVAAVQAQKWIERATAKTNQKRAIFATLMSTRGARLGAEHVRALNSVTIVFKGDGKVVKALREYLNNLNEVPTKENEQRHFDRRDDLFRGLLFAMAEDLKIDLTEAIIKETAYTPTAHFNSEMAGIKLQEWLVSVAEGKRSIPIVTIVPEEALKDQATVLKWLARIAQGDDSFPTRRMDING